MPTKSYPNPPSPKLLEKIGATNLTLADAIAEIVANSFDAASEQGNCIVEIDIKSDEIRVVDNGVGMIESVLVEATKLGIDMSGVITKHAGNKGKFGLGMKTACASMGRWWAIYTRPQGANIEYRVVFDLSEWEKKIDSADAWTINVEDLQPDFSGPLGNRSYGTAIVVKKLRSKDPAKGAVLKKLGESFKPHLEQGDCIIVNGDKAIPHTYRFVPGSLVPINILCGPKNELLINGWVAVDAQTHNDGQYGFNIYRKRQLVQTWNQDWFKGHLMTSRIIGEVHMDFIDATFFKLGLQHSDVWQMASARMKEFMKPIVRASRDLSREGNVHSPARRKDIIDTMRGELKLNPTDLPSQIPINAIIDEEPITDSVSADKPIKLIVEAEELILQNGTRISISRLERSMGEDGPPFDYLDDDNDPVGLQTILNSDHPLFLRAKDPRHIELLATADSILRYLIDRCGLESRRAVEIRNSWLLKALSGAKGTPK